MKYKIFSLRLPEVLCDALDAEALQRFWKQNSRNKMVVDILAERYQLNVPISTHAQPSKIRVTGGSRIAATASVKQKRGKAS